MNTGQNNPKSLLIVGPQPPPMGGATLTVKALLDELDNHPGVRAVLVDTRFAPTYRKKGLLQHQSLRRAGLILRDYARKVAACDAVLVFGNNALIAALLGPLYFLARRHGKRFYLKPIGGDLDLFLGELAPPLRFYLLSLLRSVDGVLPQTQHLCRVLRQHGCGNSHYFPGWRPGWPAADHSERPADSLKLIYLSQIKPEKGVFILLDALDQLTAKPGTVVSCDFYGPIYEDCRARFLRQVRAIPRARYCGVAETGSAIRLIAAYDLLVLPTYFRSEGHPGVLVEAMQAGVPVISTRHRAIPELISHGENGLLVPVQDSRSLAEAIVQVANDRALRRRLGAANYCRGRMFQAEMVVPRLLDVIFGS